MRFCRAGDVPLTPHRGYRLALRRTILAVGGQATGSHAQRRTSAVELKNHTYRKHLVTSEAVRLLDDLDGPRSLLHGMMSAWPSP